MSLRRRLLAYLAGLHLIFFAMSFALFAQNLALFLGVEVLLCASFGGGLWLIGRALEPLAYTRRFHDLLQGQEYAAQLQRSDAPELDALVAEFNAMLGALHAERLKLGEQQGFLDRLLEATPSAVVVFDFDGKVSLLNASAQQLLGLGEAKGQPLSAWVSGAADFSAGQDRAAGIDLLSQLDALPLGESRLIAARSGRRYRAQRGHFFDRGFARHFLMLEELTEELESSERATYEKLIRVLAHEVNNTVAATGSVLGSLLYYNAQLAEADRSDFTTAIEAVRRRNASLGEFIERFTRVVKMPAPQLQPVALPALMEDIVALYREPCRSRGITLAWRRCDALPALRMDRQLMEQALLNIVKNAVEAVGDGGYVHLVLAGEDGGARLSVIDSGNGLGDTPAHLLFTPFYTTKKGGQGIGLLFVREVLSRHGLPYRLAPSGEGETCFDIWWPAPSADASPMPAAPTVAAP